MVISNKIKPDFSQIKKVPTSILNIGKSIDGSKNEDTADSTVNKSLPLKDILGDWLAAKNRGTDFFSQIKKRSQDRSCEIFAIAI